VESTALPGRGLGHSGSAAPTPLSAQIAKRLRTVRRHWRSLAALGGSILLCAVLAAVFWPATYRSSGTILIEQQEVPEDLVRSATSSYAEQRVQVISQRVMTLANLLGIIGKYNLYPDQHAAKSREDAIESMRNDVALKMISADVVDPRQGRAVKSTIAFSVSYDSRSPEQAAAVANELTSLFLSENASMRKQQASGTAEFLSSQAERIGSEVAETEKKLAAFKSVHEGNLPELTELNLQLASRAQDDLREIDGRIRSLDQQIVLFKAQLAQVSPTSSLYRDSNQRVLSGADQLRVLRTQLAVARAKYSADHPDVLRLEREVAGLETATGRTSAYRDTFRDLVERRGELARTLQTRTAEHPEVVSIKREISALEQQLNSEAAVGAAASTPEEPDNPAYVQLQASLTAAQADRSAVITQRAQLTQRLAMLETRSEAAPNIEREYSQLARDLENARKRYSEVQQKQMEAQLSSNLETESKGERFTLIEPAVEPQKPLSPNRPLITLLGVMLALTAVIAAVLMIEALDTRIHSHEDIVSLVQVAPLAVIPWMEVDAPTVGVTHG
jgi:polysaccharide biosynthesis transport protein